MPKEYLYERRSSLSYWRKYLERDLNIEEKLILKDIKIEKKENEKLKKIHEVAIQNGLYINHLTMMDGNCLFESLKYIGVHDSAVELRKGIAFLLSALEHVDLEAEFECSGVLHSSPHTAFNLTNEVSYVHCSKTDKLYRYTYQTMCRDLYGDSTWNRLNTEVVLRILAIVFNYEFRIIHTTGHISTIKPQSKYPTTVINLGLMGEFHYVPVVPIPPEMKETPECPKFRESVKAFHRWARSMAFSLGRYIDDGVDEGDRQAEEIYNKELKAVTELSLKDIHKDQTNFSSMNMTDMDMSNFVSF